MQNPPEAAPINASRMGAFTALTALRKAPHCFRVIPDAAQVHCLESGRSRKLLLPLLESQAFPCTGISATLK